MNQAIRIIYTILLSLLLSFPLYAEEEAATEDEIVQEEANSEELAVDETDEEEAVTAETEESDELEAAAAESDALESLSIKHPVGETELPVKTIDADPMILLQTLKEDIMAQVEKQGESFTMQTEVIGVWSEQFADSWGKLPPLTITTEVDETGNGKSKINLPAFKEVLPDPEGVDNDATVDWKGLQGQLTFTEKFADLKADLTMQGLSIKEEGKNFTFDVAKTALKGEFDADLMPTALHFELPSLKAIDDEVQMAIQGVVFKSQPKSIEQDIKLSTGEFKIEELKVTEDDMTSSYKDVVLSADGDLKEAGIVYKISTKIGNLKMPKAMFDDLMDLDLSYVGDLELRRLDPSVVKQLQETAHNLQQQRQSGEIPADMVSLTWMAKLTELTPALLKKSPEVALSPLQLKTADGKLDGEITVSMDGKKMADFEDFSKLMEALQVQADFSITKVLLEKTMTAVMANQMAGGMSEEEALKEAQNFTDKQIKGYIEQKLLKEAGDNYELSANYKEGKFTVNGQEMPLPF